MALGLPDDTRPFCPPSAERTIVQVCDDALPDEPTVPILPMLLAADGELLFFPGDGRGRDFGG